MNSLVKDFLSIFTSKVVIIVVGLLRVIIIARWLGPELNGVFATLVVFPSIFMTAGALGIRQSSAYFIGIKKFSIENILASLMQIWVVTSILSVLLCFLLIRYYSNSGSDILLVCLAILPLPFSLFNNYISGVYLGRNHVGEYNKIEWIPNVLVFLFILLLVVIFMHGIEGTLIATALGPIIMTILLMFKNGYIKHFNWNFNWNVIKALFSLGVVYALALFVITLNYKADLILLDKLSTAYETGIYSKGVAVTEYLWQIPMFLSTLVFARSVNAKNGIDFSQKVSLLLRLSLLIIVVVASVLLLTAYYVIVYMFGIEYLDSVIVLQLLLPGVVLLTIFKVLNMDMAGKGKPWVAIIAMLPALIMNIVLNYYLIPSYGARGAAFASTISYSLAAIVFLIQYSRTVKIPVREIMAFSSSDIRIAYKMIKRK